MWFTRRERRERDLDDEIASHLRMAAEDRMADGDEPGAAQRAARRQFGNVGLVKDVTRSVWGWNGGGLDELRFAVRRLAKRPAATIVSVVTLACGIGAVAATWSLLSSVILRPLPVPEPERLVVLGRRDANGGLGFVYPAYPFVRDSDVFESTAAEYIPPGILVGRETTPAPTPVAFVTYNYFDTLGVHLPLGRGFRAEEDRQGADLVAVLTDRYWRSAFGASPDVLGRTITVRGKPTTIVGVLTAGFRGLRLAQGADLFMPYHTVADVGDSNTNYFVEPSRSGARVGGTVIVGRLSPGVSGAQLAARLGEIPRPPGAFGIPEAWTTIDVNTFAVPEGARENMGQFTRLLATTVTLLLLIGCGAVGMLMLVQAEARRVEFAVCLALGAPRARLIGSVLLEGAAVSLGGAILAMPIAAVMFGSMRVFQLPGRIAIETLPLAIDRGVLVVAAVSAVLTTFVITVVAGAFGFSSSFGDALHAQPGATGRLSQHWTRKAVVVGQVAVALVLVTGATLFARSTFAALTINTGFDASRVLTLELSLNRYGYSPADAAVFTEILKERLTANSGIESIGLFQDRGGMAALGSVKIDGVLRTVPTAVWRYAVDSSYVDALGLSVTHGRALAPADVLGGPLVAVVSESLAGLLAQDGEVLGRRIEVPSRAQVEVVGVVPDVIRSVAVLQPLTIYMPLAQWESRTNNSPMLVKVSGDIAAVRRDIVAAIRSMDSDIAPPALRSIEDQLAQEMASQRFGMNVLGGLGAIATLLTLLGMYVVAESNVVQRMRETAIRAALGATPRQIGGTVMADTLRLVVPGIVLGLALVWFGSGLIRGFLFGIQPLDTRSLAEVAAAIVLLSVIVSIRPALRLARLDLARVLKEE